MALRDICGDGFVPIADVQRVQTDRAKAGVGSRVVVVAVEKQVEFYSLLVCSLPLLDHKHFKL